MFCANEFYKFVRTSPFAHINERTLHLTAPKIDHPKMAKICLPSKRDSIFKLLTRGARLSVVRPCLHGAVCRCQTNNFTIWSKNGEAITQIRKIRDGVPGGGVMTLHDYGYLPPGFLKSYPASEWNFQIYTASESGFLPGIFFGIYCYANFLCYANFSIVFYCFKTNCFWGGANSLGKLLEGKASSQPNNVSKHTKTVGKSCFQRKP